MKKRVAFVVAWLVIACLPAFAGGAADLIRGRGGAAGRKAVAEGADSAEVPERDDYIPRQYKGLTRATGEVYALPAEPLKPEAERLPPPVYAISGVKGQEIREGAPWEVVDIVIDLPGRETFSRGILEGEDVSNWIANLPGGLEARAHGIKKGAKTVKIYVSGRPEVTMREVIQVTIPGTYLKGGNALNFVSPTEAESFETWEAGQTE
jgi:hypothetical protein